MPSKPSELDQLLAKAHDNPGEEKYEHAYYELFLNSDLYIPTVSKPKNGDEFTKEDKEIDAIVLPNEGKNFVMIFDDPDDLMEWAQHDVGILKLRGHQILSMFSSDMHFMLNILSDQPREFTPEEVQWLLSASEPNQSQEKTT